MLVLQQPDYSVVAMRDALQQAGAHHVAEMELPPERAAFECSAQESFLNSFLSFLTLQYPSDLDSSPVHARHLVHSTRCHTQTCFKLCTPLNLRAADLGTASRELQEQYTAKVFVTACIGLRRRLLF